MKTYAILALKGFAIGVANVIPGVSGGTIAFITGIFEELIYSLKSFDIAAVKLLLGGKFGDLAEHVHLKFLASVLFGVAVGIFSLAKVLNYLFVYYPIFVWAFFFGLILGSVYFLVRKVETWSLGVIAAFAVGDLVAVGVLWLRPGAENGAIWYLIVCGAVSICAMILPGLSGSFVLMLMGNYHLVVIEAITELKLGVLIPFAFGAAAGLIAFSHFLSWIFKHFKNSALALLTGFILGSQAVIWPWKHAFDAAGNVIPVNKYGAYLDAQGAILEDVKAFGYKLVLPDSFDMVVVVAIALAIAGIFVLYAMEACAERKSAD